MFTLILLSLVITFLKSLHFLYLFQIKEYRFDRFLSLVKEKSLQSLLYSFHLKYPAKTIRNGMIMLYILIVEGILLMATFEVPFLYYFLTFIVPFAPFLSLLFVSIGVYVTKFPVFLYRRWLMLRARMKVKDSKTVFIGITGSFGKTSVKEYVFHILSQQFKTGKTFENQNTDVGIALSILKNLQTETEYFVTEFGAYRTGEIKKASAYIPLQYVIVTGLGNQHLDLYGSRENLINEETYLLKKLSEHGKAYIQADMPHKDRILKKIKAPYMFYGMDSSSEIRVKLIPTNSLSQKAEISYKDHIFTIETVLLGVHSIENLLPAIALGLDLGIKPQVIRKAIADLPQIPGKLSLHTGRKKALIINDAVNSNVEGFIAAIKTLKQIPRKQKIIVSQGIIELGVEKRSSYEKILEELHKADMLLFTTDQLFKELTKEDNVHIFNDVGNLQKKLLTSIDKHSAILIEGKFPKSFIEFVLK